ncbi:ACT domain-containing protein [Mucilaginibacter gynuensis]|uniref:ACT domain-containing protein n=1 Tax=Mucilaginibacter gynuensis TaxID=1302236 RepID=A0ABP8HKQ6_9SPHI
MNGETNLQQLLKNMTPILNPGDYVYCTLPNKSTINLADVVCTFREEEGLTVILKKEIADNHGLPYTYVAAWLTLTVHSSLAATGLTAAFAGALADAGISCNVVAAYYHDHIFVAKADAEKALNVLKKLSAQ